jgi:hypothetical protein
MKDSKENKAYALTDIEVESISGGAPSDISSETGSIIIDRIPPKPHPAPPGRYLQRYYL